MKALILVGGFGTRLRPFTLSIPKPLIEFANVPLLVHQIRALAAVGVTEIIMAVQYKADVLKRSLQEHVGNVGVKLVWSPEDHPLGTAGPLKQAEKYLRNDTQEPFFVLNSDITCSFPLADMLKFHKSHGKTGTIAVTKVEEPSKYGVVVMNEDNLIQKFVEKPTTFVGNKINAGIYLFQSEILDIIDLKPTSIERETFPTMVQMKQLYSFTMPDFWMDVGQPKDYLLGTTKYLNYLRNTNPDDLASGPSYIGNVLKHPTATIGSQCAIGPNVVIGPGCIIKDGVRLKNVTLFAGSTIDKHSWIDNSIIGWKSFVGKWVRLQNLTLLGEDVTINDELFLNGVRVLPHKNIKDNHPDPIVIM